MISTDCSKTEPFASYKFDYQVWEKSLVAQALARAFTPPPDKPIWQWADEVVWLQNEDAAEPGPYRSAKTPWTRRLQELIRTPEMLSWDRVAQKWVNVRLREVNVQKSSQSGFSEAALNAIRWRASFRPCNVIYAIDTADEAKKIARRLLRSFKFLDPGIYTGDPDDIKSYEFLLRGMEILFYGSFSSGKFANKQAPFLIADEVEEHGQATGDTSTLRNMMSRKKTSSGGIQINLSKPKLHKGPINQAFTRGNQEEYFVPCPHCGQMQFLTFFPEEVETVFSDEMVDVFHEQTGDLIARMPVPLPLGETRKLHTGKLVYDHCKDLLGGWDELRILREAYYECSHCHGAIYESSKAAMLDKAEWRPMTFGSPGIISQHMSDLYSRDEESSWGVIILEYLTAKKAGRKELQGVHNHRFGKAWKEEMSESSEKDILSNIAGKALYFIDHVSSEGLPKRSVFESLEMAETTKDRLQTNGSKVEIISSICPPYKRGTIPFQPVGMILGADVGGNYAKWAAVAVAKNLDDVAVFDWGEELDPDAIAEIMMRVTWPCLETGKPLRLLNGFIDGKWRKTDVYKACLAVPGRGLVPVAGIGGTAARVMRAWTYQQMPTYTKGFKKLDYNDREAKDELYTIRIKRKERRVWFPVNVAEDPVFIAEMTAERLIEDASGRIKWDENPPDNHYGDCVKNAITGLRFLTRRQLTV